MNIKIHSLYVFNATLTPQMSPRLPFLMFVFCSILTQMTAQDEDRKVRVNGAFQGTLNYFIKDERIGAANIPQYERVQLSEDEQF